MSKWAGRLRTRPEPGPCRGQRSSAKARPAPAPRGRPPKASSSQSAKPVTKRSRSKSSTCRKRPAGAPTGAKACRQKPASSQPQSSRGETNAVQQLTGCMKEQLAAILANTEKREMMCAERMRDMHKGMISAQAELTNNLTQQFAGFLQQQQRVANAQFHEFFKESMKSSEQIVNRMAASADARDQLWQKQFDATMKQMIENFQRVMEMARPTGEYGSEGRDTAQSL
eukprot:gnl/TRDRNA2_/TRDRNA2_204614_c0_seq1.p1 gnl/TRDRNA2_/TRDRNA2_204614_c0~~gnl/TRDRNA2_/TRDRNA2_204614_c0_seq1.p1  ORF type:complete len:227 (-),score=38.32 gnl/TRDRNA2_/TRDRNA2_204614_c0_seq1:10-690(-)